MTQQELQDVDILRARAMAAALKAAMPKDYLTNDEARIAWYECCKQIAHVVCTAHGVSLLTFYDLCGVPD